MSGEWIRLYLITMEPAQQSHTAIRTRRREIEQLANEILSHNLKGIPYGARVMPREIEELDWNVLNGDLPFPLLVLKNSAIDRNLQSMADFCVKNNMLLAPHGKTTMCPQIFARQLDAGAWAITVATVSQAMVCASYGINRILIANQVVGDSNIRSLVRLLNDNDKIECYCLIDSVAGVRHLSETMERYGARAPLNVLIEWGRDNWRSGVRSERQALEVAVETVKQGRFLKLCGVEAYEGLATSSDPADEVKQVDEFLSDFLMVAEKIKSNLPLEASPILSFGGSSFLDRAVHLAKSSAVDFRLVLRSGCYVTSDHGFYAEKLTASKHRSESEIPDFQPALELWSYVQSLPEPQWALLTFGKRDCPTDLGFPVPLFNLEESLEDRRILTGAQIAKLNDQHAYMTFADDVGLKIGSKVCCGISHPCTVFDKWRVIPVVDDNYNVIDLYRTFF
jgi:D-serine dehydratase